jgi:hypothetical protein
VDNHVDSSPRRPRGAYAIECPECAAPPGQRCRRSGTSPFRRRGGATVPQAHAARVQAARQARGG